MNANKPWSLFHWKTAILPKQPLLDPSFSIRQALIEEKEVATQVAILSLRMNTEWHEAALLATQAILEASKRAFTDHETTSCLVITHGKRIIGTSILDVRPEAPYHLLSGPWVLTEYRNRGFGSILLHASLQKLAEQGINEASGITVDQSTSARFIYPKFRGVKTLVPPPDFL